MGSGDGHYPGNRARGPGPDIFRPWDPSKPVRVAISWNLPHRMGNVDGYTLGNEVGTWYLRWEMSWVPGTWYQVPGTRYQVLGTRYLVPGTWYLVPGTIRVPSAYHPRTIRVPSAYNPRTIRVPSACPDGTRMERGYQKLPQLKCQKGSHENHPKHGNKKCTVSMTKEHQFLKIRNWDTEKWDTGIREIAFAIEY